MLLPTLAPTPKPAALPKTRPSLVRCQEHPARQVTRASELFDRWVRGVFKPTPLATFVLRGRHLWQYVFVPVTTPLTRCRRPRKWLIGYLIHSDSGRPVVNFPVERLRASLHAFPRSLCLTCSGRSSSPESLMPCSGRPWKRAMMFSVAAIEPFAASDT